MIRTPQEKEEQRSRFNRVWTELLPDSDIEPLARLANLNPATVKQYQYSGNYPCLKNIIIFAEWFGFKPWVFFFDRKTGKVDLRGGRGRKEHIEKLYMICHNSITRKECDWLIRKAGLVFNIDDVAYHNPEMYKRISSSVPRPSDDYRLEGDSGSDLYYEALQKDYDKTTEEANKEAARLKKLSRKVARLLIASQVVSFDDLPNIIFYPDDIADLIKAEPSLMIPFGSA